MRDEALRSGRLVFDYGQLATLGGMPRGHAKVYASRLVRKGLAAKVANGIITFTEDPFLVATQLVEPSYVSLNSALYLRGSVTQVPSVVECVTTRTSTTIGWAKISYHRIVPPLMFGYERVARYGGYLFAATKEKAVLDMVYYGMTPRTEELDLDEGKLRRMGRPYHTSGGQRGRRVVKWVKQRAQ
ncbi:MAG: hypothetical protein KGI26_06060 [Thaumarchaeota archaeon]|nr:hypothetical protein [Nitrososphaerota archaeon]